MKNDMSCYWKIIWIIIFCSFFNLQAYAGTAEEYMQRFNQYQRWSENLPSSAQAEFIEFLNSNTPLAQKLRNKWLRHLAANHDWKNYQAYYQASNDIDLQCFYLNQAYQESRSKSILDSAKNIWLSATSTPVACDKLFTEMLKNRDIDDDLIAKRVALALDKKNTQLAIYLLKQMSKPHDKEIAILSKIHNNPRAIASLQQEDMHEDFCIFGLKRLVSVDTDKAIQFWNSIKSKQILDDAHLQTFYAQVALYKAIRNHDDTEKWFAKVKPAYRNAALMDWEFRYALKKQNWSEIEKLAKLTENIQEPVWQYWLARALEAQGRKSEALLIYNNLAHNRNYYGFLSSMRLNKKLQFQNEDPVSNSTILKAYKPLTDQIYLLYKSKQLLQASRLLNDFVLELPKDHASALAYWIATQLQWHDKSLYLSNNEVLNNQLQLRFPLAYLQSVRNYAKQYGIPAEFVYAVIRQESTFREDVISSVGAHGLMQLMPETARTIALKEKIDYKDKQQLFSPVKNINLGVAYLKQLSKRYGSHPLLMAAAYNAGPKQVNYWLKNHPPKEIDIWIETLPWPETRNYLKNIISFYAVYQYRMNQKPDLSLFMNPLF